MPSSPASRQSATKAELLGLGFWVVLSTATAEWTRAGKVLDLEQSNMERRTAHVPGCLCRTRT
eukprot:2965792-Rhodomonas_salina.1